MDTHLCVWTVVLYDTEIHYAVFGCTYSPGGEGGGGLLDPNLLHALHCLSSSPVYYQNVNKQIQ